MPPQPSPRQLLERCVLNPRFTTVPIILMLMVLAGEGMAWFGAHHFRVGVDLQEEPCLPWRLYLIRPFDGQIVRGKAIAFRTPKERWLGEAGKIVAATGGDRIRVKQKDLFINDRFMARLATCDNTWKDRYCLDREYVLAADEVFVMAPHKHSFDSRYWGPVNHREITGEIAPLSSLWSGEAIRFPEMIAERG